MTDADRESGSVDSSTDVAPTAAGPHPQAPLVAEGAASDAYVEADRLLKWYIDFCRAARRKYQVAEVALLVISASVPVAGVLAPGDARWAAVLGAVVTILTGMRAVFHWHENWTRGSLASSEIVAQLRAYRNGQPPYQDPSTRDAHLTRAVNDIEMTETKAWTMLKTPQAGPER